MIELLKLSISEVSQLIKKRKISPVEIVEACLSQVEKTDAKLFAYITLFEEESLQTAKKMEEKFSCDNQLGDLFGIPITLKDNISVKNTKTTAGSRILSDWRPNKDALIVKRLKAAGAIILGKTNLHEFAWGATSENDIYGTVKNPWDQTRIAGGSSGGSAAAVSAMTCYGSIGTDTGGSIRLPASLCGLVGLRPTYEFINNDGIVPLAFSMDTSGPITRTVKDCEMIFKVMAFGEKTRNNLFYQHETMGNSLDNVRIGIIENYFGYGGANVLQQMDETIYTFKKLGAKIRKVTSKNIHYLKRVKEIIQFYEASNFHKQWIDIHEDDYGPDVRDRLLKGLKISTIDYIEAKQKRILIKEELEKIFKEVDIIICPTVPFTAPKIGKKETANENGTIVEVTSTISYFTSLASITGMPALTLPCGFDENQLPIGVQLIGRPHSEMSLLKIGEIFQRNTDFHLKYPQIIN